MSKCENCIHYEVCCEMVTKHNKPFFVCGDKGNEGQHFKSKSLFVELPCKVGDFVYMPWQWDGQNGVACLKVLRIAIYQYDSYIVTDLETDNIGYKLKYNNGIFEFADIGKTVFLTKEEAEKKLKEVQNG